MFDVELTRCPTGARANEVYPLFRGVASLRSARERAGKIQVSKRTQTILVTRRRRFLWPPEHKSEIPCRADVPKVSFRPASAGIFMKERWLRGALKMRFKLCLLRATASRARRSDCSPFAATNVLAAPPPTSTKNLHTAIVHRHLSTSRSRLRERMHGEKIIGKGEAQFDAA